MKRTYRQAQSIDERSRFITSERCFRNIFIIFVILFGVIHIAENRFMNGVPISHSKLSLLTPGLSQDEVKTILGNPSDIERWTTGDVWFYGAPFMFNFVAVHFDSNQRYVGYVIDD